MIKRVPEVHVAAAPADPNQWSEQSKRSAAYHFKYRYVDAPYKCWRCGAACLFTAQDQKYTFEVKKASIHRRRTFCSACWSESHRLRAALSEHDARWVFDKSNLRSDNKFLTEWLELLACWQAFAPYKQDIAKINMLRKLLGLE
jgi:hypothetical protein